MKKKHLFLAATAIFIASCSDTSYLGDQAAIGSAGPISFESSTPNLTRTTATDAAKLDYKFKVFGVKTIGSTDQRVFATATSGVTPYDVWFVDGSGNSTTSNSSNWEYVGTGATGGTKYGTSGHEVTLTEGTTQTIKYWDNNATYNFQAWSDINATKVDISAIDRNTMTITGTPAQLANFWISDLQSGAPNDFTSKVVQFTFRKAATKVRLGIYETVQGYHVRNLKFKYTDANNTVQTQEKSGTTNPKAILNGKFMGNSTDSKQFTVSYANTTEKRPILTPSDDATKTTFFDFGEFIVDDNVFLGEASISATWANTSADGHYTAVFPNTIEGNIANMVLKIDYELYNEKSGEVISITNATAEVPAAYMTWKANYAYTYLFKITDDKLNPITLDAVVIDDGEGKQETITTVTDPSITTYQYGSNVTATNEYSAGEPIYVVVNGATLTAENAKLYTATATDGYPGGITEATVANAFAKGTPNPTTDPTSWSVTEDAKTLTIAAETGLTPISKIPADDSPTGADLTINGAYFTPTAPASGTKYYVFQYVKVAPVAAQAAYYTAVADGTTLASGTTYYTFDGTNYVSVDGDGSTAAGTTYYTYDGTTYTAVVVDADLDANTTYYTYNGSAYVQYTESITSGQKAGTTYYSYTAAVPAVEGEYQYKVIKVQ